MSLTIRVMKQITDSIMMNIETEYDCPSIHPELDTKVAVLDLGGRDQVSFPRDGWLKITLKL